MKRDFSKITCFVLVSLFITSLVLISSIGDIATAAETPQYGGTLIIRHQLPTGMGYPAKSRSRGDLDHGDICVETLFQFDQDGKPIPWLVTSWKYSTDLKSLMLNLRQGVKFHDDTDFNAAAVKTNLDLCLAAKKGQLASVSSVDVIDNYTVKLNLTKIDAYLLYNLGEAVGFMVSPAALAKGPDFCLTNPVGTGPFKQVEYNSGVSVKFKKWEGYWQKGKPYLDAVEIVYIPEDMTAMAAFKKGEVHMLSTRDAALVKDLKNAVVTSNIATFAAVVYDSANKNSPFSDLKVRQAIAHAIDKNTLQESFGEGLHKFIDQPVFGKSSKYYNPNIKGYPYNVEKAKEILSKTRYPNGFKMDLIYANNYNNNLIMTAIKSMLAEINVQVDLKPVGSRAATQFRFSGKWKNGGLVVALGTQPDPGNQMQRRFYRNSEMYPNVARSEEYDAILEKILVEPDFDKRIALNHQLTKQYIDNDCMFDQIFNNAWIYVTSSNLKDTKRGVETVHHWTPQDAWFSK